MYMSICVQDVYISIWTRVYGAKCLTIIVLYVITCPQIHFNVFIYLFIFKIKDYLFI